MATFKGTTQCCWLQSPCCILHRWDLWNWNCTFWSPPSISSTRSPLRLATANLSSVSSLSLFTFLHVSEITLCLSFSLLVVSALLWRVLAGCPTNFWNRVLPSHCPSWRIYRAEPATPSPQPRRVSSPEATFQGSRREGRLLLLDLGGPWRCSGPTPPVRVEEVKPETQDLTLLTPQRELLPEPGMYCLDHFSTNPLLSLFFLLYTRVKKRHHIFWRFKAHLTESDGHSKVREPSLGGRRVRLDSPSAQAWGAGGRGHKEGATGMVPSPQML